MQNDSQHTLNKVSGPHKMVRLERMSDHRLAGLQRFTISK